MWGNVFLRKYTLKFLGIKGHDICKLFSNGSEKMIYMCTYIYLYVCIYSHVYVYARREDAHGQVKQISKMLTIGEFGKSCMGIFGTILVLIAFL